MQTVDTAEPTFDRIEAIPGEGAYEFYLVAVRPDGTEQRVTMPPEGLESYSAFRRVILLSTGILFVAEQCEGRPELVADEHHHAVVRMLLDRGRRALAGG